MKKETKKETKKEMKKETKKAPVKALAKTITKPQTVDVTGLKVLSVTLTDNGKLVIKYAK